MKLPTLSVWSRNMLTATFLSLLFVYLTCCLLLWAYQDRLVYPHAGPTPDYLADAKNVGLVPYNDPDGNLLGFVSANSAAPSHGTVIVFHGNGSSAFDRSPYVKALEPRGFQVILYEYPGYGGRGGQPSEKVIVDEGRALVNRVQAAGQGPVYLWGESLGSGAVGSIAADPQVPVKGVVLITPFHSLSRLGWSMFPLFPIPLLIRDHYNTVGNLAQFKYPIFVAQAENDQTIPSWSTRLLLDGLPAQTKNIQFPDADHSTWPSGPNEPWWDEAVNWITGTVK